MGDISSAYLEELSIAVSHTHTQIEIEVFWSRRELECKVLDFNAYLLTQPMDGSPTFKFKKERWKQHRIH